METGTTAERLETLAPVSGIAVRRDSRWAMKSIETVVAPDHRQETVRQYGKVKSSCPALHEVFDVLARFAATDVSVTLIGETGTGKDVLARALHDQSARATGPFIIFDCGAVAPNLAESELFGHERGAFTGAINAHSGAFERADAGTLFLDEIGELPLDLQPRLLRVLESRLVRRVGGGRDRPVDVRILAATHRNLRSDVSAGKFRQDLFYRLGAAVLTIPPLRERLEDLPILVRSLLGDLGRENLVVGEGVLTELLAHRWPGNVRELKNVLACAVAFIDDTTGVLQRHHLRVQPSHAAGDSSMDRLPLGGQRLDSIERVAIQQTLAQCDGNKVRAANTLGIAVSTLYEKLKKYRITGYSSAPPPPSEGGEQSKSLKASRTG
jgi:transcriptional regulator with PAS, ATPase and Fis domain